MWLEGISWLGCCSGRRFTELESRIYEMQGPNKADVEAILGLRIFHVAEHRKSTT